MASNSDRKSQVAKAGKRHGTTTYPPTLNPDKQAAREAGEQQFTARAQQYIERVTTVYDRVQMRFVNKTMAVPVDFTYDAHRKREIHSPAFKGRGTK